MSYPIRTCVICHEEFELKPGKPGYANRCPDCSANDETEATGGPQDIETNREMDEERRKAMRDLLYRKDS